MIEYRVRWKREGRRETTRIYQAERSAYRKAEAVLGFEGLKAEIGTSLRSMPDLEEGPVIETRRVGEWESVAVQVTEVPEHAKKAMLSWATYTYPVADLTKDPPKFAEEDFPL